MIEKLKQKIKEELSKLPREIQEGINSFDWVKKSEEIGKKNFFTEEEINKLQAEVLLILVGIEQIDNIKTNIEINVETTRRVAEQIENELITQIFEPISQKIESSIKENLPSKNPKWDQRINFILSGGDYSNFIGK